MSLQTTEEKLKAMLGDYYRMGYPGSPNAAILQNMLGANNELRDPQSENEALLKLIYEDVIGEVYDARDEATRAAADAEAAKDHVDGVAASIPEDFTQLEADVLEIKGNYAKQDGSYDSMTVGNAEQIVSTVFEEDKVPYLFRTSGGSIDIGDREVDEIHGGTVAWNQRFDLSKIRGNGASLTDNGDGTYTAHNTNTGGLFFGFTFNFIPTLNHIYFIGINITEGDETYASFGYRCGNWMDAGRTVFERGENWNVYKANNTQGTYINMFVSEYNASSFFTIKNPVLFDLTQMFGPTIADYIYSLETATPGAGVAWFRKLFPADYYAYDAGSLKSVEGLSAHKMTGFNQWDEEWEVGSINSSGVPSTGTTSIRSKNYIPIIPGTTYYYRCSENGRQNPFYYDANKNFIGRHGAYLKNQTFVTPPGALFMKIGLTADYGTTYLNDICINLHWDGERDGEYEPYDAHSYPLDDSLTLRGIPKLDANNQLYYDGDVYESDGTVTRRYGVYTFDGTEAWGRVSETINGVTYNYFRLYGASFTSKIPDSKLGMQFILSKPYAAKYGLPYWYSGALLGDKLSWSVGTAYGICIYDDSYSDGTTFKAAMNGMVLVYELATPTTESVDAYQNPQVVDDWGTEEYVSTGIVPVGHYTKYQPNLRAKLEMAPNSPSADGDYIMRHENGENAYVLLTIPEELPAAPAEDGNYILKCTVSGGEATYTWEAQA